MSRRRQPEQISAKAGTEYPGGWAECPGECQLHRIRVEHRREKQQEIPVQLAAIVKNRLKSIQYRPALIESFLARTGLALEPEPP